MKNHLKIALLFISTVSGPAFSQGQAPFCAVTAYGQQCYYYTVDACRQAAGSNGMCVANQQPQQLQLQQVQARPAPQPQQIQTPDIVGSFQRGYENGARMRQQREEHEMRMRVMEAQLHALEQQQRSAPYICLVDGKWFESYQQGPDCYAYTPADR